jgi:hypothetical protein
VRILGLDIDPGRSLSSGRPKAGLGSRDDEDSAALMRRDQISVDVRFRAPKRSLRRSKKAGARGEKGGLARLVARYNGSALARVTLVVAEAAALARSTLVELIGA